MKAPCQGCPDREIGCHGRCEKYAAYRADRDTVYDQRRENRDYIDAKRPVYARWVHAKNIKNRGR